jgi:hypothetical protein
VGAFGWPGAGWYAETGVIAAEVIVTGLPAGL